MSLSTIFSAFGILIAAVALLPSIRRQEYALKIRPFDWLIICIAVLIIHYTTFLHFFLIRNLTLHLRLHRYGITPEIVAYFTLITTAAYIYCRITRYRLNSADILRFKAFIDELLTRRMYPEASLILGKNIRRIFSLANSEYSMGRIHAKFKRMTEQYYPIDFFLAEKEGKKLRAPSKIELAAYHFILLFLPDHKKRSSEASYLLRTIMTKKDYVKHLAQNSPYLGMSFLQHPSYFTNAYIDSYFRSLLIDKNSILYFELKNNQNTDDYAYDIDPHNILISYLFDPATIAEKLGVWRPVGEYFIQHLDELYNSPSDKYLIQNRTFYEDGQWESSLWVSLYFFDVMIKSALKQNIQWHMWLYYYKYFVDGIERNLSRFKKRDEEYCEWDSPYHYLLYTIVSKLCDYIRAVERIPLDQENVKLSSVHVNHDNGNIVKSSILCLMTAIRKILLSDNLSDSFKEYLVNIPFSVMFTLQRSNPHKQYFLSMRNALIAGGYSKDPRDSEYRKKLAKYAEDIDTFKYDNGAVKQFISDITQYSP